jgi:UDP-N-acetylmuramate: L-alanyl-gamma-D-glutamyl-meso-diaminopimelate ligase
MPARYLRRWATRVRAKPELGALVAAIAAEARDGDHMLVMSNGGFGGIHEKLLAALARS